MKLVRTSAGAFLREDAAAAYELMNDAFTTRFGKRLSITSGARTIAESVTIFVNRYRQQASGDGPYDDVRFWDGTAYGYPGGRRWVRHSGLGTAAVPGTSTHIFNEKTGAGGIACDFGSGVNNAGSVEHRWMQTNAYLWGWVWPDWAKNTRPIEYWHWERRLGGGSGAGGATKGFLMALTDQQQSELYDAVSNIYAAIFGSPGKLPSLPQSKNIPTQLEEVRKVAVALQQYVYLGGPQVTAGTGAKESIFGRVIATQAQVGVDETVLAAELAPLIAKHLSGLTDADVEELARAAADEQDRRTRERMKAAIAGG